MVGSAVRRAAGAGGAAVLIDVHCHYTLSSRRRPDIPRFRFEPAGDFDSCVSPRAMRRLSWRVVAKFVGLRGHVQAGPALDEKLDRFYEKHILTKAPGGAIDRYVLLAFDWYHDNDGRRPALPERHSDFGSDIYTSNSLIRAMCVEHPDKFLFGASIHPYRRDALDALDEVFAAGACLNKWIPLHQNVDVCDDRTRAFLRRCAELGLPLLVHYGPEFTLATQHRAFQSATGMLDVLRELRREGRMPTVIFAHVATPVWPWGEKTSVRAVCAAIRDEFANEPLYADVSAFTNPGKSTWVKWFAQQQDLHPKFLYGSDFPVPVALPLFRGLLGREYRRVGAMVSWPEQAIEVLRAAGFNEIVFQRAAQVLPNLAAFAPAAKA